jgi:DNA polymerase I-like protein with 3'-5' exonuclease and polymerase domains
LILKADGKAIEWRVAVELSGDKVGLEEILNGVDQHRENQILFRLPGWDVQDPTDKAYEQGRLMAKTFLFRLIYGGSAYAYANDPAFTGVSRSEKFWQEVIDETYNKYRGLAKWHKELVQTASIKGSIIIPSGREYKFTPEKKRGELVLPRTKILNYPVQGFAADLVMIARVSAWRRMRKEREEGKVVFFNSVHDDIEIDVVRDSDLWYNTALTLEKVFLDVPRNVERTYGYTMKVPISGEVSFGNSLGSMKKYDRNKGVDQFQYT